MTPYRIKRHRKRSNKVEGGNHMTLVPFIDMLTILVVFLLVHTSDVDILPNTKNISIPESISDKKPRPTVVVMITKEDLLVDGRSIATGRTPNRETNAGTSPYRCCRARSTSLEATKGWRPLSSSKAMHPRE